MSQSKLERVLDLLINEEQAQAEALLHEFVVEKARDIYESLVSDEYNSDELEGNDSFIGGDETENFIDTVSSDTDDIAADELNDGEVDLDGEGNEGLSGQIGELSDQLSELRDMFNQLIAAEMEEPAHADDDLDFVAPGELDDADGMDAEVKEMYEATVMHKDVAAVSNEEGKLAGTGKNSKTGATGKESPYTHAPTKRLDGADPVDFTGEEKSNGSAVTPKKDPVSDNITVKSGNVASTGQETEGKLAGTGQHSKTGAIGKQSPLSVAPKL